MIDPYLIAHQLTEVLAAAWGERGPAKSMRERHGPVAAHFAVRVIAGKPAVKPLTEVASSWDGLRPIAIRFGATIAARAV